MATHLDVGKEGEKLAEAYLADKGYAILHRNWRYGRYEIDLITSKNELLHFIEVKFRSYTNFAKPEEAVNKKKIKSLVQAIDQYLYLNPQHVDFRLDILCITQHSEKDVEYFLVEDVYL